MEVKGTALMSKGQEEILGGKGTVLHWAVAVGESESRSVLSDSLQPHGLYRPWNSPGQNTGVGSLSLLQGIFPTQESNPGLPPCRQRLYHLSRQGSPIITHVPHCYKMLLEGTGGRGNKRFHSEECVPKSNLFISPTKLV